MRIQEEEAEGARDWSSSSPICPSTFTREPRRKQFRISFCLLCLRSRRVKALDGLSLKGREVDDDDDKVDFNFFVGCRCFCCCCLKRGDVDDMLLLEGPKPVGIGVVATLKERGLPSTAATVVPCNLRIFMSS